MPHQAIGGKRRAHWSLLGILLSAVAAAWAWAEASAAPEPSSTPYRLHVDPGGKTVRLEGLIDFGITRDLTELLEAATAVRLITLESPGGRVAEARGLIKVIERFDLATSAVGDCASACALVYMGGHSRYLEPGARLGFHRYGLFSPLVALFLDAEAELEKDMALFRRRDVAETFIERIVATPHERMWFPSPAELLAARVVDVLGRPR
jgi:hypothetical protein